MPPPPTGNFADAFAAIAAAGGSTQNAGPTSETMRLGAAATSTAGGHKFGGARGLMGSGPGHLAPTIGAFRSDEILGHDLSQQVRGQLQASQKYQIDPGRAESVTRIVLPDYVSVSEELPRLQAKYPDQLFGLNYIYRSYRRAGDDVVGPVQASGNPHGGCDAARCYGPTLIGWHRDLEACARNVVVGIIDTGLDEKHPALKRLHLIQHPADVNRRGENWHGTGVTALLAGARESSTPGLIPDAQYVLVDAFFMSRDIEVGLESKANEGVQQTITDTDHLVWALETLQQNHAQVVNMSLVGPRDAAIHAAIRRMTRAGVVFIAAAGNGGPAGAAAFPAAYPEVIAVTALDRNKRGYAEANHGGYIDVAAPGVRVWTALPGDRQGFLSGTSFAAPFVTAIAAATYNSTPMRVAVPDQARAFDPKREVIGRMAVEKLNAGDMRARDTVFGWGLAHAPSNCSPPNRSERLLAQERSMPPPPPARRETGWRTQVHHASSSQY